MNVLFRLGLFLTAGFGGTQECCLAVSAGDRYQSPDARTEFSRTIPCILKKTDSRYRKHSYI